MFFQICQKKNHVFRSARNLKFQSPQKSYVSDLSEISCFRPAGNLRFQPIENKGQNQNRRWITQQQFTQNTSTTLQTNLGRRCMQEVPRPANNKLITFWRSKNLSFVWQTNLSGKSLQPQHFNKNVMPINKRFVRPISHNNASSFTLRLKLLNDHLPSQRCLRLLRHSILHYPPSSTNQKLWPAVLHWCCKTLPLMPVCPTPWTSINNRRLDTTKKFSC